jgi:DNA-binding NtrC family response regulator
MRWRRGWDQRLPRPRSDGPIGPQRTTASYRPGHVMTCVLVVEGDRSASAAIQALLELEGFEVVIADGGLSGLLAIESSAFDAVIIDVLVPRVDGLDTIRALHERAPMVPIIAIASHKFRDCLGPERDFLGLATNLGAAAALYKPFMPRDLVTAVATCVDDRSRTRAHQPRLIWSPGWQPSEEDGPAGQARG